jgi:hypothetical protein
MTTGKPKPPSRGRPPLPQFTLTAPEYVPFKPGQREAVLAILADIILSYHRRIWRADRGLPPEPEPGYGPQREEEAGQSPAS